LTKANDASLHPTRVRSDANPNNTASRNGVAVKQLDEHNPLKRKRTSPAPEEANPKLKEFLNVMKAPSKHKSWANETELGVRNAPKERAKEPIAEDGPQSDEEYQSISKKHKARQEQAIVNAIAREESEEPLEFPSAGQAKATNGASVEDDTNWLKSRTGALLGLEEDQEEQASKERHIRHKPSTVSAEPEVDGTDQELGEATVSPLTPNDDSTHGNNDEAETQIRSSKRLFLRNLPFTITEEALMDEFSTFGSLEEVRHFSFSTTKHTTLRVL
jgi:multiple RNA-binding domain-containing protein 1